MDRHPSTVGKPTHAGLRGVLISLVFIAVLATVGAIQARPAAAAIAVALTGEAATAVVAPEEAATVVGRPRLPGKSGPRLRMPPRRRGTRRPAKIRRPRRDLGGMDELPRRYKSLRIVAGRA